MEDFILDSVTFIGNIDFSFVLRMFFYIYLFFWIMVVIWVWYDASERSSNVPFKVFSVVITLLFNVFGLLIYLLVRPADSYEERYLNELEKKYLQLETAGITECPACNFDIEPSFVVCPKCGEPVKVKCDNCQEYIDSHWGFCAYCGIERVIPEVLKKEYSEIVEEELYKKKGSYRAALAQCVFKVGEKQNQCIEKARELFRKNLKKKPAQKDEIIESKAKTKKSKKKSKKKKNRK
jgi:predicted RNA-binding Zn-ribbon protein involved in translation (DUF1610 family)